MRAAILLACTRVAVGVAVGLAVGITSVGCSPSEGNATGEVWPIFTESPGVLGYVALPAAPRDIVELGRRGLDWSPGGLSGGAPVSVLLLDEVVFGSPLALALPIDDEAAFRASLEACPLLRHVRGDSWLISIPPGHPALTLLRMARSLSASQSPADLFEAMRQTSGVDIAVELVIGEERAILAPSFEAGLVVQRVLRQIPGLAAPDGPLVVTLDARRFHLAYQEEIQGAVNKARGMLLGVQMAGFAAMLAQMKGDNQGDSSFGLPLPGPAIWALLEMLSIEDITGVQLSMNGRDLGALVRDVSSAAEGQGEEHAQPTDASVAVRMVWEDGSTPAQLLAACRPVAEVPGATALGFDPVLFPAAVAQWARPLVELTMGEGPPAERLIARIEELIAPCQGTLVAGLEEGGRAFALPVGPGQELDVDGMAEVLGLFARTLDLEGDVEDGVGGMQPWDGVEVVDGAVPAGRYWQSDDVFFVTFGECAVAALDKLAMHAELAAALPPPDGLDPFFAAVLGDTHVRMYADGDEFLLELPLGSSPDR